MVVITDADGDVLYRALVKSEVTINSALDKGLVKYATKKINWLKSLQAADNSGKLLVVAFDKKGSDKLDVLEHPLIAKHHDKCVFVKFPYERGSALVKEWSAYSAPTVIVVDPAAENPAKRPLAKIASARPLNSYRKAFLKAFAKLEQRKKK